MDCENGINRQEVLTHVEMTEGKRDFVMTKLRDVDKAIVYSLLSHMISIRSGDQGTSTPSKNILDLSAFTELLLNGFVGPTFLMKIARLLRFCKGLLIPHHDMETLQKSI